MKPGKIAYHVDRKIGDGVESTVLAHHRRRLRKLGWERALDPGPGLWAEGEPPPRPGCSVEVLVDGAEAIPEIVSELESARSHVHFTGWYFSPDFDMKRDPSPLPLRELLGTISRKARVRVLLWGGAPLPPPFHPSRRDVRARRRRLSSDGDVDVALDSLERPLHCHHEKTIVIDDRVAFVGGLDFTTLGGDRFDSSEHPARGSTGWHDATTRLRGPIVADVADHFRMRWKEVTGQSLPAPDRPGAEGETEVQLIRTIPEKIYSAVEHGDFRILESYTRAISSAQRFIYLENQFLWSPEIVRLLQAKLANPPSDDFRIVVVLPSAPITGADDTKGQLAALVEADSGERFLAATLYARAGAHRDPIYVHAKIGIVDDRWLTIGSANLNEHSLFNDTEVNVVTGAGDVAKSTRHRLWAEHLEVGLNEVSGDPAAVVDELWKPIAYEQLDRHTHGRAVTHRLVALPHVSKRAKRLLGPIQSLLVDG
jgi:phosphatidylserine/phosphatidylglycerophosphate/cardiolipin synthase-like enzyme